MGKFAKDYMKAYEYFGVICGVTIIPAKLGRLITPVVASHELFPKTRRAPGIWRHPFLFVVSRCNKCSEKRNA